jgi:Immunity protein 27
MKLGPEETDLTGKWEASGGRVIADTICRRIDQLIARELVEVSRLPSGWAVLYRDPQDARLWELTYSQGELHGGGPPRLTCIPEQEARERYGPALVAASE